MSQLLVVSLIISLAVEAAAVSVLGLYAWTHGDRRHRALALWGLVSVVAYVLYSVGVFVEVYAVAASRTVINLLAVLRSAALAATPIATSRVYAGSAVPHGDDRRPTLRIAAAGTVVAAAALPLFDAYRLFGPGTEALMVLLTGLCHLLAAVWFGAAAVGMGISATGAGTEVPEASVGGHAGGQMVLLTAILAIASLLLSLDVFLIDHRINRGIRAGFLARPVLHALRGVAIAAVLIPALARWRSVLAALEPPESDHTDYAEASKDGFGSTEIEARLEAVARECGLTARERDVVAEMLNGDTSGEISLALGISEKTVQAHLYSAFRKCGVHSRTQMSRRVFAG